MTATKDATRPTSQHRLSIGSTGPNFVNRSSISSSSRQHAHSVSLGSFNTASRINRRKSSFSANSVNKAALAAAAREAGLRPISQGDALGGSDAAGGSSSAVVDGPPLSSIKSSSKSRSRRASDGSRLIKERRNTNSGELKSCDVCGKSYKHGSCLQKHLWEHTPEWQLTSKFLISKHAQVQLLEAASVLVNMNQDKEYRESSETSSQSPVASGSSGAIEDDDSSSRTSTPSDDQDNDQYGEYTAQSTKIRNPRRQDSYSSVFSRSYQSTAASSVPNDAFYSRQWTATSRPSTAGAQSYADEQADIAAAAEGLVSCSIGTPQFRPTSMHMGDVPPVPPLPAKFAAQASPYLTARSESSGDVDMSDDERRFGPRDEDEDGVFGRME